MSDAVIMYGKPVAEQIEAGKEVMVRKYKAKRFIAYFQPYTNTYASPSILRALYDEALGVDDVVGLIVGTRPDCLPDEVVDLLAEYAERTYFWLELGLQSPLDRTLDLIGRGHDFAAFARSAQACKRRGIRVCSHVILGLPGETREEMLATADVLNDLDMDGVKIHLLHVMKGTPLADLYRQGKVRLMDRDEYVGLVCDFLERLAPTVLIQRLVGDGSRDLIAPRWNKLALLNAIDAELERRGTRQGDKAGIRDQGPERSGHGSLPAP